MSREPEGDEVLLFRSTASDPDRAFLGVEAAVDVVALTRDARRVLDALKKWPRIVFTEPTP